MIIKPIGTISGLTGFDEMGKGRNERDDDKLKEWGKRINDPVRAREAYDLWQRTRSNKDTGSSTLPELLTEVWLNKQGVRFTAQAEMGIQRPDFVLHDVTTDATNTNGSIIFRVQGDHWHNDAGKDTAKSRLLVGKTYDGQAVDMVIDLRESDIYAGEHVFEQAVRGYALGNAVLSEGWTV